MKSILIILMVFVSVSSAASVSGLNETSIQNGTVTDGVRMYNILTTIKPIFGSNLPTIYLIEDVTKLEDVKKERESVLLAIEKVEKEIENIQDDIFFTRGVYSVVSSDIENLKIKQEQLGAWKANLEAEKGSLGGIAIPVILFYLLAIVFAIIILISINRILPGNGKILHDKNEEEKSSKPEEGLLKQEPESIKSNTSNIEKKKY